MTAETRIVKQLGNRQMVDLYDSRSLTPICKIYSDPHTPSRQKRSLEVEVLDLDRVDTTVYSPFQLSLSLDCLRKLLGEVLR